MKKTLIALAFLAAFAAHATGSGTPGTGNGGGGGGGGGGGAGVGVGIAAAQSLAFGGGATATGGTSSALGGAGFGGSGSASVGSLNAGGVDLSGARIGGDTKVQRSAPPVYAPQPTAGGLRTCPKPGMSLGGSGPGGGGLLSFSFGSDTTCRVEQALGIMDMNPAIFTADDRLTVSCKQEDIAGTATCEQLAKRKAEAARATAVLEGRPQVTAAATALLLP